MSVAPPPRRCRCGEAMMFRVTRQWPPPLAGRAVGFYLCHHCDAPCAGTAPGAYCPMCKRAGVVK